MIWVTTMHDPPRVAATNILSHATSTRDCQFGSPQPPWVATTRNVVMRPPTSRNNLDLSRATSTKGRRFGSPQPLWVSTACDLVMQPPASRDDPDLSQANCVKGCRSRSQSQGLAKVVAMRDLGRMTKRPSLRSRDLRQALPGSCNPC